ncbi:MAG TPA: YqgE/AlgH family protein [Candidatus Polarisedimenticolaceae bacterium]|nr:YqgE/AlgH family protein [Candidatus Polarisedimenticolaceae bacterium]
MSDRLAPGFLVAAPQLLDPNFRRSVVLLLQQGRDGAIGVVINHESPLLLKDLCDDHAIDYSGDPDKRVRKGGPVQPEQGLVLYGAEHRDPEGRPVIDGLHVSASRATLERLCRLARGRFHCYSGYAGWGPGQLEREIGEGSWIVAPVDTAAILDGSPEEAWVGTLRGIGIDPAALVPGGDVEA